ncbi:MAG: GntR family transcriptional regulator [Candidatus Omnitrophica bacterium]|nr:GntR family transcriptional regulator [Candidatus Omnitrophota bacterium]
MTDQDFSVETQRVCYLSPELMLGRLMLKQNFQPVRIVEAGGLSTLPDSVRILPGQEFFLYADIVLNQAMSGREFQEAVSRGGGIKISVNLIDDARVAVPDYSRVEAIDIYENEDKQWSRDRQFSRLTPVQQKRDSAQRDKVRGNRFRIEIPMKASQVGVTLVTVGFTMGDAHQMVYATKLGDPCPLIEVKAPTTTCLADLENLGEAYRKACLSGADYQTRQQMLSQILNLTDVLAGRVAVEKFAAAGFVGLDSGAVVERLVNLQLAERISGVAEIFVRQDLNDDNVLTALEKNFDAAGERKSNGTNAQRIVAVLKQSNPVPALLEKLSGTDRDYSIRKNLARDLRACNLKLVPLDIVERLMHDPHREVEAEIKKTHMILAVNHLLQTSIKHHWRNDLMAGAGMLQRAAKAYVTEQKMLGIDSTFFQSANQVINRKEKDLLADIVQVVTAVVNQKLNVPAVDRSTSTVPEMLTWLKTYSPVWQRMAEFCEPGQLDTIMREWLVIAVANLFEQKMISADSEDKALVAAPNKIRSALMTAGKNSRDLYAIWNVMASAAANPHVKASILEGYAKEILESQIKTLIAQAAAPHVLTTPLQVLSGMQENIDYAHKFEALVNDMEFLLKDEKAIAEKASVDELLYAFLSQFSDMLQRIETNYEVILTQLGTYSNQLKQAGHLPQGKEKSNSLQCAELSPISFNRIKQQTESMSIRQKDLQFEEKPLQEIVAALTEKLSEKVMVGSLPQAAQIIVPKEMESILSEILQKAAQEVNGQQFVISAEQNVFIPVVGAVIPRVSLRISHRLNKMSPEKLEQLAIFFWELYDVSDALNIPRWKIRQLLTMYGGDARARVISKNGEQWIEMQLDIPQVDKISVLRQEVQRVRQAAEHLFGQAIILRDLNNGRGERIERCIEDLDDIVNTIKTFQTVGSSMFSLQQLLFEKQEPLARAYQGLLQIARFSANEISLVKELTPAQLSKAWLSISECEMPAAAAEQLQKSVQRAVNRQQKADSRGDFQVDLQRVAAAVSEDVQNLPQVSAALAAVRQENSRVNGDFIKRVINEAVRTLDQNRAMQYSWQSLGAALLSATVHKALGEACPRDIVDQVNVIYAQIVRQMIDDIAAGNTITGEALVERLLDSFQNVNKQVLRPALSSLVREKIFSLSDMQNDLGELVLLLTRVAASAYRSTERVDLEKFMPQVLKRYDDRIPYEIRFSDTMRQNFSTITTYKENLEVALTELLNSIARSYTGSEISAPVQITVDVRSDEEFGRYLSVEILGESASSLFVYNPILLQEIEKISGARINVVSASDEQGRLHFRLQFPISMSNVELPTQRWNSDDGPVFLALSSLAGALRLPLSYLMLSHEAFKRIHVGFLIRGLAYHILQEGVVKDGTRNNLCQIIKNVDWQNSEEVEDFWREYGPACRAYARKFVADGRLNVQEEPILFDEIAADEAMDGIPPLREEIKSFFNAQSNNRFMHTLANDPEFHRWFEEHLWQEAQQLVCPDENGNRKWQGVVFIIGPRPWQERAGLVQVFLEMSLVERAQLAMNLESLMASDSFTRQETAQGDSFRDVPWAQVIKWQDFGNDIRRVHAFLVELLRKAQQERFVVDTCRPQAPLSVDPATQAVAIAI